VADRLLLESSAVDGYLLEDGSGVVLSERTGYSNAVTQTAGLVGYWRLGESSGTNANDEVSTNDGTYTGTPTLGATGALSGDTDTAVTFASASSQYVNIPDVAAVDLGDVFSLEAWINVTGSGARYIVSKSTGAYALAIFSDGTLGLRIGNGATLRITNAALSAGWHHVVGTKNGATTALYVDGAAPATTASANVTAVNNATALLIGGDFNAGEFFNGSIDEVAVYNVAISEATALAHYNAGAAGPVIRSATDALALADTTLRVGTFQRSLSDALAFADSGTRLATLLRAVTDALSLADSAARVQTTARSVADALGLSDAVTRTVTLLRSSSDSLTSSDAAVRVLTAIRSVAQSLSLADAVTASKIIARTVADALNLADAATRSGTFVRSVAQSLSLSDVAARVGTFVRAVTDALTLADAAVAVKLGAIVRTVTDSLGLSDAATRSGTFVRSVTQSLLLADVVTRGVTRLRTATDALGLSDAASRAVTLARSVADGLSLSDVGTRLATLRRTVADALSFGESVIRDIVGAAPIATASAFIREIGERGSRILAAVGGGSSGSASESSSTRILDTSDSPTEGSAGSVPSDIAEVK